MCHTRFKQMEYGHAMICEGFILFCVLELEDGHIPTSWLPLQGSKVPEYMVSWLSGRYVVVRY